MSKVARLAGKVVAPQGHIIRENFGAQPLVSCDETMGGQEEGTKLACCLARVAMQARNPPLFRVSEGPSSACFPPSYSLLAHAGVLPLPTVSQPAGLAKGEGHTPTSGPYREA